MHLIEAPLFWRSVARGNLTCPQRSSVSDERRGLASLLEASCNS